MFALTNNLRTTLYCLLFCLPFVSARNVPGSHLQARDLTNSSKAGLGWANADTVDIRQYTSTGNVSWYYTWSAFPTKSDIEFVPMFWGNKSIDQFNSTMQQTLSNKAYNVTSLLGMNELRIWIIDHSANQLLTKKSLRRPELAGQSNITPEEGADMWKTYVQPFHDQGLRLGSPAPSSSPTGKTWLQGFLSACGDECTVDFIAMHWYGTNASQLISYLEDFNNTFQKPLWITEWACQNYANLTAQCSSSDVVEFMNATQSYMDNADFVERYAWFGAMENMQGINEDNALMDNNGKINSLGRQYIGGDHSDVSLTSAAVMTRCFLRFPIIIMTWFALPLSQILL
ncbi:hypothetical protein CVT25_011998 [Psilocybe cyanescens]|uniref:Asl1-like glycosyl hydrolase catalytic domain-containing protein n=1 Tax=Psilocybe cyanescens TaxID=93625 RepID=A0A409XFC4_PSICY|nr:hypothetical protein CVT25_011998 [Psilocybe cyanescens]